jgi:hypothetical protein
MNLSPHRRLQCSVATLLLMLAFFALPAGASPRDWSFFSSPWSLLSVLWENYGAVVDPNGQPSDYGAVVDPGGRSAPGIVVGNLGAVVDPSGQPAANPGSQELGAVVDPDGQPNH